MADNMMYLPDVMVSLNTMRPVSTTDYDDIPTFWCETCRGVMRGPVTAIQHLIGKDHLSKMKKNGKFPTRSTGTERKKGIEMVGYENIPLKKIQGPSSTPKPLVSPALDPDAKDEKSCKLCDVTHPSSTSSTLKPLVSPALDPDAKDEKNCKLCDVTHASGDDAKRHYAGKRHREAVRRYKEKHCKLCDVKFANRFEAKQHHEGKRHREAVRRKIEQKRQKRRKKSAKKMGGFGYGGSNASGYYDSFGGVNYGGIMGS